MSEFPFPADIAGEPEDQAVRLAEAFRVFSQASAELSEAYGALQGQVQSLTLELAAANGELRRQYDEKARLTEKLTLLLERLPAGVLVVADSGQVESANPAARELLGIAAEGAHWHEVAAQRLLPSGVPGEWLTAGDDVRRVGLTRAELASGGQIVLLHDTTEHHRLLAEKARHERLAAMGEMAAEAAHQLRTPLAAAMLYLGMLERPDLAAAERARCMAGAGERLRYLERLIRDMLAFARGGDASAEPIAVGALVADTAKAFEPLASARGVMFSVSDGAPGAWVSGSRQALAGALTNLLENALQAAGNSGFVELAVQPEPGAVVLAVRDSGPGVPGAVRERLFEPFFTTRAQGTGLGLAIARGVARAHGGDIACRRAQGPTEFVIYLPLTQAGQAAA